VTLELAGAECRTTGEHCITCGDEGIPMRIVECRESFALCADETGELHEVAVDLVGPVEAGDELLVHAGVAIGQLGAGR
jgi:hydrogenase assembly chaperone HypC/HupF